MLLHGISHPVDMKREICHGKTLDTEKLGIHHRERGANSRPYLLPLHRITQMRHTGTGHSYTAQNMHH